MEIQVLSALQGLVGLQLTFVKSAVDMRSFKFGDSKSEDDAQIPAYSLHVLCPWRIQNDEQILTGRSDYYKQAKQNSNTAWKPGDVWGNLQNERLAIMLGSDDRDQATIFSSRSDLVVESVAADAVGGCTIKLSGGFHLLLFPDSSEGEAWRLISREPRSHFVMEAGESYRLS